MGRRTPRDPVKRRIGRPTALTDRTAEAILAAVERGNHITTACALSHVDRSTLYRWLQRADQAEYAIQHGQEYDPNDLLFIDFRNRLAEMRAHAEARAVSVVERSMAGGFLISEKPVVNVNGDVQRDDEGNILYERAYSQPDGRLALSYLGKSRPDVWGQNPTQRLELTGADGAALGSPAQAAAEEGDHVKQLAGRLALVASQRADEDPDGYGSDPPDGIHDADIVEDEAG